MEMSGDLGDVKGALEVVDRATTGESSASAGLGFRDSITSNAQEHGEAHVLNPGGHRRYRVYKRRWFGLFQLTLLNIIVSWDVSATRSIAMGRDYRGPLELAD